LAKDNALPATLEFYEQECIRQGAAPEQVQAVAEMRQRLTKWRNDHGSMCKTPDVQPGELQ
jgi:hypothetical protein